MFMTLIKWPVAKVSLVLQRKFPRLDIDITHLSIVISDVLCVMGNMSSISKIVCIEHVIFTLIVWIWKTNSNSKEKFSPLVILWKPDINERSSADSLSGKGVH